MARWTMTALPPAASPLAPSCRPRRLPLRFIQLFARGVQRRRRRTCSGCLPGPGAGPSTPARTNAAAMRSKLCARRGCTRSGSAWEWRRRAGELGVGVGDRGRERGGGEHEGASSLFIRASSLFRRVHPGWDVALHVQHAPDVHGRRARRRTRGREWRVRGQARRPRRSSSWA